MAESVLAVQAARPRGGADWASLGALQLLSAPAVNLGLTKGQWSSAEMGARGPQDHHLEEAVAARLLGATGEVLEVNGIAYLRRRILRSLRRANFVDLGLPGERGGDRMRVDRLGKSPSGGRHAENLRNMQVEGASTGILCVVVSCNCLCRRVLHKHYAGGSLAHTRPDSNELGSPRIQG